MIHISRAYQASANKVAARAASPDYVRFQAVIKSAASAASLRGGRASGRLDHDLFFAIVGRASGQKIVKNSDSDLRFFITFGRSAAKDHEKMAVIQWPPCRGAVLSAGLT